MLPNRQFGSIFSRFFGAVRCVASYDTAFFLFIYCTFINLIAIVLSDHLISAATKDAEQVEEKVDEVQIEAQGA